MVNIIWIILIASGIIFGLFTNKLEVINTTIVDSTKISLEMLFKIFPVLALWMGITKIAEVSGLLKRLSNKLSPFLTKVFPEIPKGHESLSLIASNMIANIFGLGSAATPFGLKAMSSLQKLNKNKKVASRSMITFLVINTSSVTIIPTTVISIRMLNGSTNPSEIVGVTIITTLLSTFLAIILDRLFYLIWRKKYD